MTEHAPRPIDTFPEDMRHCIAVIGANILERLDPPRTALDFYFECSEQGYRWLAAKVRDQVNGPEGFEPGCPELADALDKLADHEVWTVLLEPERSF